MGNYEKGGTIHWADCILHLEQSTPWSYDVIHWGESKGKFNGKTGVKAFGSSLKTLSFDDLTMRKGSNSSRKNLNKYATTQFSLLPSTYRKTWAVLPSLCQTPENNESDIFNICSSVLNALRKSNCPKLILEIAFYK